MENQEEPEPQPENKLTKERASQLSDQYLKRAKNASESRHEKKRIHWDKFSAIQDRVRFYLIAAASACMGFTLSNEHLDWSFWVLSTWDIAIVLWGVSFVAGFASFSGTMLALMREGNEAANESNYDASRNLLISEKYQHFVDNGVFDPAIEEKIEKLTQKRDKELEEYFIRWEKDDKREDVPFAIQVLTLVLGSVVFLLGVLAR